jgi:hypothetical protein
MEYKTEKRKCANCKKEFVVEPDDFSFYEKIKVPPPTWCPNCRIERKMVFRNERSLYKRKCDLCEEEKILIYPKDSPYQVYCCQCFYSDDWDGIKYGLDYDFSKTFFEQYAALYKDVPRLGIIKQGFHLNTEYVNRVSDSKNCYLIFGSNGNENCYYGVSYWDSKDSIDCYNLRKSERCAECIDCYNCSNLRYSRECNSCIDSWFLNDCRNCQNCFGCNNLRNKNYCLWNKQYSREEYLEKIKELKTFSRIGLNEIKERVEKESLNHIMPALVEQHCTNVSGNWLENSKNIHSAFNCDNVEDGNFLFGISDSKDVWDLIYWGKGSELIYESINIGRQCSQVFFSNECWDQLIRAEYCTNCFSCSDLFGCAGLRKKKYCILNKQYEKEEYFKIVERIKKHMDEMPYVDKKGKVYKYGEFFPADMAPFGYNESICQEYMPKTKEQALSEGYSWKEPDVKNYIPTILPNQLPDSIDDVKDGILDEIISCGHFGRCNQQCTTAFRIIPNELAMYRLHKIPLPILCPNCRHYERLTKRPPPILLERNCAKCGEEVETAYDESLAPILYCEKCYRQEVY